jgi:hypothetical protein
MAGAAELPRPGVEVIQEFTSTSPTIVRPTLVPCNVAPFFEVIEAVQSDGNANPDAKLSSTYRQFEMAVTQSSFPSPRKNIDEVNVLEETVRVFFEYNGLLELSRTQGYLRSYLDPGIACQAYVTGTNAEPVTPVAKYDLDGKTLIFQLNSHTGVPVTASNLPRSKDITITFQASIPGGRLTLQEVIDQINLAVPDIASAVGGKLRLTSTKFGARSSVVIRWEGTANAPEDNLGNPVGLGFPAESDYVSVGSGFYADDDSDGDQVSPRLKIYAGTKEKLLLDAEDPFIASLPNFLDDSIEEGDTVVADGVAIGDISVAQSGILTMGVEQYLMSYDAPFAPRRLWVRANNLSYPAPSSSISASETGSKKAHPATVAYVTGQNAIVDPSALGVGPSESFSVNVVIGGVAQPTQNVSSGAGWTTLAAAVAAINNISNAFDFEAYVSNAYGDEIPSGITGAKYYLGLRTKADNAGSHAALTVVSMTSGMSNVGFSLASLPFGDIGENARFRTGTPAFATSSAAISTAVSTESISYTPKHLGNATDPVSETVTWSANHTTLDQMVADWNSQALFTEAYKAVGTSGVESSSGTFFAIRTRGENFGTTAAIDVTATDTAVTLAIANHLGSASSLNNKSFKWSLDFNPRIFEATLLSDEEDGGVSLSQIINKINEQTVGVASASSDSPPALVISSQKTGEPSQVKIGDGSSNTILGFTYPDAGVVGSGRPAPDMALDITGNVIISGQVLRDPATGLPYDPGFAPVLLSYKGLRLDLSPEADHPSLILFSGPDELSSVAPPISTDNPGSLMCYLSMLNAPNISIAAIGVPEVSSDAPDGTPLGYARCAEFLQNEEVYSLATASQNPVVHQAMLTHVNAMSEPEQKGERIYFFNPAIPDRALPTIIGSGTDCNSASNENEVTVDVNLAPALLAAGIDPNSPINPASGAIVNEVYLDISGDDKKYLVQAVTAGTIVKVRTSFASNDGNTDAFYSTTVLPTGVISNDWSVNIRGEKLLVTGTNRPDNEMVAETIQKVAQTYGFRRGYYVHPDKAIVNVTGSDQQVPGYYATACISGMVGQLPPQQGFTNYPITGLVGIVGGSDRFTQKQLNVMAAGGVYILVQDAMGAPVLCRHQLSTDMGSIEKRELSITKVVDYTAKFLRTGLRNFIGRSNITQPFLDNLSTVVEGQLGFLTEAGVLVGAKVNNIIQDADAPDTVLIDVTLDVPYPCNYIRLTLVV